MAHRCTSRRDFAGKRDLAGVASECTAEAQRGSPGPPGGFRRAPICRLDQSTGAPDHRQTELPGQSRPWLLLSSLPPLRPHPSGFSLQTDLASPEPRAPLPARTARRLGPVAAVSAGRILRPRLSPLSSQPLDSLLVSHIHPGSHQAGRFFPGPRRSAPRSFGLEPLGISPRLPRSSVRT